MQVKSEIWLSEKNGEKEYFSIPSNEEIQQGLFLLENRLGEQIRIDEISARKYLISNKEAENILLAEIKEASSKIKNSMLWLSNIKGEEINNDFFQSIFQLLEGNLLSENKGTVNGTIRRLLDNFANTIGHDKSHSPNMPEEIAKEELQEISTKLKSLFKTEKFGETVDRFLKDLKSNPKNQQKIVKDNFEKILAFVNDDVMDMKPESEEERKQQYHSAAQKAIKKALEARGIVYRK